MFKLRQTWNEELPKTKLCELDVSVKQLDPAWPIVMPQLTNNIHLNPKFLHNVCMMIHICTRIFFFNKFNKNKTNRPLFNAATVWIKRYLLSLPVSDT